MKSKAARQGLVWGGALILLGALSLVSQFVELSAWVWVVLLVAGALLASGFYLTDRSDWAMLITAYALWAIALLVALVTLNVLRDDAVAAYGLLAVALPFLAVFYRDRAQWWALIPAYVMLAVGVMIGLTGLGVLDDGLVPAYVLFAIAIPFFVVYARDRRQWWPLIPGGILALVGLSFLIAEAAFAYIGALLLILVGVGILVRVFTRRELPPEVPGLNGSETEDSAAE